MKLQDLARGAAVALVVLAGCSKGGSSGAVSSTRSLVPDDQRSLEARPGEDRTPVESDIYAVDGTTLLVQNPARGFAAIDVTNPDQPRLLAQLPSLVGKNGELYARGANALVVFEESAAVAGQCEVASIANATTTPTAVATLDLAGTLVASRIVGDILYVVTTETDRTHVFAVLIADPTRLATADELIVRSVAQQIHVTDSVVFLAETKTADAIFGTTVRLIDITDPSGKLAARGTIDLRGFPQGRFDMDALGTSFRIVTFSGRNLGSNLYAIEVSDLDRPAIAGKLEGLAPGEDLHAVRFVGDRAYVTTYQPTIIDVVGMDPLWVVSLTDPRNPTVLGELHIPGWSDYVFPDADRLVAVGRGDLGERVAVALFDVSNPTSPTELRRVEFGVPRASSEANTDFRGVKIIDKGVLGADAMIVVPYTNNFFSAGATAVENRIQLIDLLHDDLVERGSLAQTGFVRRAFPLGTKLYSVTDKTVAAIDVTDRDAPVTVATVVTGDLNAVEKPIPVFIDAPVIHVVGGCEIAPEGTSSPFALLPLALGLAIALAARVTANRRVPDRFAGDPSNDTTDEGLAARLARCSRS